MSVKRLCVIVGALHELTYADLAGERWYTTGLYLTKRATGDVPNFVEMKVGRVPGDGIVRPAKMPEVPASLAADEE